MREALALLLAFVAASLYALSTSLQALEARQTDPATALSASLLGRLARRRLWLLGAAAGIAAWPMQLGALAIGAVALVQPALGFGLVVLLVLGVVVLHERVGPRELAGVAGIALALGVLAWAAPSETGAYTAGGTWLIGAAIVVLAPLPPLLRRANHVGGLPTSIASGVGWTVVALATSLVDESLADRRWAWAVAWGIGVALASWGALLAEMTALQTWPATRAIPIAFGLEMLVPAALSPALTRVGPPHPVPFAAALALACAAVVLLGGSRAVAHAAVPLTEP